MEEINFVRCPKCQSLYWFDIPNLVVAENMKWRCFRCSYQMSFGACSKCKTRNWQMTRGIDPKGGHRPMYRFQCRTCGRVVGIMVYS
jgi:hypothetical protein